MQEAQNKSIHKSQTESTQNQNSLEEIQSYSILEHIKEHPILAKLICVLTYIFRSETSPTRDHLIVLILAMCALNSCVSIHFLFVHFIVFVVKYSLRSFYYTLGCAKTHHCVWSKYLIEFVKECIPYDQTRPNFLAVDDTLVEKEGKDFDYISKLHDHAKHNGTCYLFGHCFVCVMMIICIRMGCRSFYISFPVAFRMWRPSKNKTEDNEYQTKLEIAAELCKQIISQFEDTQNFVVIADSWYPKGVLLDLIKQHANVEGIFNVRKDTVLYKLAPSRQPGQRGAPCKKGQRININTDLVFIDIPDTDYRVAFCTAVTKLFGYDKVVMVMVTESKVAQSRRVFICTDPEKCAIDIDLIKDPVMKAFGKTVEEIRCFCPYSFRWAIEVNFQEQKSFWGLENYKLRSAQGIENLVNLQSLTYAILCLLPYMDSAFSCLQDLSIQERRFAIGRLIERQQIMYSLIARLQSDNKSKDLAAHCAMIARQESFFSDTAS